jgi:hypothetical protein
VTPHIGPDDVSIEGNAALDTGFDRGVILTVAATDTLTPDGYWEFRIADGSLVKAPIWEASVEVVGLPGRHAVLVAALGNDALVGREVTDRYTVILDHGRRLIIEP